MLSTSVKNPTALTDEDHRGGGRVLPIFLHIVTLINRSTGVEVSLEIETFSDRFTDVIREISAQKAIRGLLGYEIFEVLDCNDPF